MLKVYIASPYRIGDKEANVRRQMDMADRLITAGFCPFVPLYTHFQQTYCPRQEELDWLLQDFEWLKVCHVLLRLDGESEGADAEVDLAKSLKIPVVYSFEELRQWAGTR